MPESAPDQAPRALLAFSPTARVLGFSGPPGAAASGGQHRHALARPKRDAGSLAWTHEHQNRRATSSHDRISAPAPSPPPAPSEAGPPGAPLRHALHGTVGLTHAPRSSADAPASPISRLVHPHATVLPPTRPPKSTGRLAPHPCWQGPGPTTRCDLQGWPGPAHDPGSSLGSQQCQNQPQIKPRARFSRFPPQHEC
jgi:hypothetical protein